MPTFNDGNWGYEDNRGTAYGQVVLGIFMFAFAYNAVFVSQKFSNSARSNDGGLRGILIGFSLAGAEMMAVKCGTCLNPAIAMAQTTIQLSLIDEKFGNQEGVAEIKKAFSKWLWIYMVIPFASAAVAAVFVKWGHAKASKEV